MKIRKNIEKELVSRDYAGKGLYNIGTIYHS